MTTFADTILFYVNGIQQQSNSGDTISISRNLTIASPSIFSVGVNIVFASGFTPTISQSSTSTTSGSTFTVQAQGATGAAHNGGILNLSSGTSGSATIGTVNIQTGGTTQLAVSPTTITIPSFSTAGILHNDSSGNLSSSLIVNADVSASAAVAVSKLAAGTAAQILLNNSTPTPTWTTMSGDVSLTSAGATKVLALQNVAVNATAPTNNQFLRYDSTDGYWNAQTVSSLPPSGAAGGDLSGTYPNPTVAQVNAVAYPAAPSTNTVPVVTGSNTITYQQIANAQVDPAAAIAYSKLNLTGDIVNADINSAAAIVYSKLSLSNSIVNADVNSAAAIAYSKLNLTGSIVNGDIAAGANLSVNKLASGTAAQFLVNNSTPTPTWTTMSGDVSLTSAGATKVLALQNIAVNATAPTNNQFLRYDSADGYWNAQTVSSLPPSGSAGGDLSGTYPNPTVANVNAVAYPASPSTNTVPVVTGSNVITYQQIANAQVSNTAAITYNKLNIGNSVVNSDINSSAAIAVSKLAAGTSAQILLNSSAPTPTWTTISGDGYIGSTGVWTNSALQQVAVPVPSGTNTALTFNGGVFSWAVPTGTGITALTGDVTASGTGSVAATVAAISGASPIMITPANLQFTTGTTNPKINIADNTAASGTGTGFNFAGQNATGTGTTTGGNLNFSSGTGTTPGNVNFNVGATGVMTFNSTAITPNISTISWTQSVATPAITHGQKLTNAAGANMSITAQQGQTTNNTQGGNLLLTGGPGGGSGLTGGVRLQLGSTSSVMMEATQLASTSNVLSVCGNTTAITTTQMPSNSGNGVMLFNKATANPTANCSNAGIVLYADATNVNFTSRDNIGTTADLSYASSGTVNTQIQKILKFVKYGRITTTGSTLTINIPLATSTTNCKLEVNALIKIATAGSLNAAGDTFNDTKVATFKNVAGTVSQVGTSVDLTTSQADTSLNTSAISFTISTTNIVVTLTANATTGTLGNADCSIFIVQTIN